MSWANFDWRSHARTDVGRVRKINEDACLDQGQQGLWVVADGMGGHAAGDVASQLITQLLGELEHPNSMAEFVDQVDFRSRTRQPDHWQHCSLPISP